MLVLASILGADRRRPSNTVVPFFIHSHDVQPLAIVILAVVHLVEFYFKFPHH
jgi:hypothetical protein